MNYFNFDADSKYPTDYYYRPSELYPEYPFKEYGIADTSNDVYRMIREIFCQLKMDIDNYGTENWNPLGKYITPGNTVLVKPNMVFHYNYCNNGGKNGLECLVTHPSVIRCVLDYVIIALKGKGKIILGDAPVQSCVFPRLMDVGGYHRVEQFYERIKELPYRIEFIDFRAVIMKVDGSEIIQEENHNRPYEDKIVNIGDKSLFSGIDAQKLRVLDYSHDTMVKGHSGGVQEYCISDACLQADVIVNLPKPKSHRFAGMTAALKNMIGANSRKEYLPHYTKGALSEGGDAYSQPDKMRKLQYKILDVRNHCYKEGKNRAAAKLTEIAQDIARHKKKDTPNVDFGSWEKNDTIWRTILDIDYAVRYADKQGEAQEKEQRKIISIGDMIVSGEKNGPITPTYKKVGGILFADDSIEFDWCTAELMGFDYRRIPYLNTVLGENEYNLCLRSNESRLCGKEITVENSFGFASHEDWRGYIEKGKY